MTNEPTDDDLRDDELRAALKAIDESPTVEVSGWAAEFIESVCYKHTGRLSPKQRAKVLELIDEYGDK